jgi:hypothetical protein
MELPLRSAGLGIENAFENSVPEKLRFFAMELSAKVSIRRCRSSIFFPHVCFIGEALAESSPLRTLHLF